MNMRLFLILFLVFQLFNGFGQEFKPISPMDIPLYLSGNFGEIRSNHFHTGIDIKTMGVEGVKVVAVEQGYVSRIKVGRGGYGHALYLTHPNGYITVYGHLQSFTGVLHDYVRSVQYDKEKFEVDLYLDPDQFKFNQGDVIAFSGNSGGSSGPHLHFEIRDAAQRPLNVLSFGLPIEDNLPPVFKSLISYDLSVDCYPKDRYEVVKTGPGKYGIKDNAIVSVSEKAGFGVEVYDYLNGAKNRCGVYALQAFDDGSIYFDMHIDKLSFSTNRYINSHIDYHEKVVNRKNVHKLFQLPNNKLSIYKKPNKGRSFLNDNPRQIVIVAEDRQGNKVQLEFQAKRTAKDPSCSLDFGDAKHHFKHNQDNVFTSKGLKVKVPALALYSDISFKFLEQPVKLGYSNIFHIHDPSVPLHKGMEISIAPNTVSVNLKSKLYIAKLGDKKDDYSSVGGSYKDGYVTTTTRGFGKFFVSADTLKPTITALNFKPHASLKGLKRISLKIQDPQSGIQSYRGTIDGKWVLFQYDAKNDEIYYEFADAKIMSAQIHKLSVEVIDRVNNRSYFDAEFEW